MVHKNAVQRVVRHNKQIVYYPNKCQVKGEVQEEKSKASAIMHEAEVEHQTTCDKLDLNLKEQEKNLRRQLAETSDEDSRCDSQPWIFGGKNLQRTKYICTDFPDNPWHA